MRIGFFILFGLTLLSSSFHASAQTGTIEGYINDVDTRAPIIGATINIPNNFKVDNTDAFGSFRFSNIAAGQYELVASHIGYKTEIIPVEVKANYTSTINVQLRKSNLDLSEVKINTKRSLGLNTLSQVDIMLRPVNTSQDILR